MKPLFNQVQIPPSTTALLWDMDGVLLDSLQLDIDILNPLFSRYLKQTVALDIGFIKSIFAYDPTRFVDKIFDHLEERGMKCEERTTLSPTLLKEYKHLRCTTPIPLLPGVRAALEAAGKLGLKQAVVSNNPQNDLLAILKLAELDGYFSEIVGNDLTPGGRSMQKKPAPDFYLYACEALQVPPARAVVFEDSALGCTGGLAAGCYVIGLLTGSASEDELRALTPPPHAIFENLTGPPNVKAG
jgi:HAD superfamily hydrolase (TIGR01509 family)